MKREYVHVRGILVTVEYRKVKNVNLYIKPPDGQVLVTAPEYVGKSRVREFLESKEEWIVRNRANMRRVYEERANHPEEEISKEQLRDLADRVRGYAEKWESVLGVRAKGWTLRKMKTRWGSCTVDKGKIRINTRLVWYPAECLEYVVVHELCHLLEAGHSPRFWAYVENCLPDWRERRRRLRDGRAADE